MRCFQTWHMWSDYTVALNKNVVWIFRRRQISFNETRISRETCEYFSSNLFREFYTQLGSEVSGYCTEIDSHVSYKINILSGKIRQHLNTRTAFVPQHVSNESDNYRAVAVLTHDEKREAFLWRNRVLGRGNPCKCGDSALRTYGCGRLKNALNVKQETTDRVRASSLSDSVSFSPILEVARSWLSRLGRKP